jgi:serine protease inhibitor
MKAKNIFTVLALIFVVLLIYRRYSRQFLPVESDSTNKAFAAGTNDIKAVVGGNTDFAIALYSKLTKDSNTSNLFFSPYSISTVLAMTYGGARGETQKQMATALHFTLPDPNLYSAFGTLQKQLIQENKSRGYQLLLANALWGQKGEPFLKEFLDLTQCYGAGFNQLDFVKETEQSRQKINLWIEEKTKDKIKDLIPQGSVNRDSRLVLTNAIYFKGDWRTKFKKRDTESADFAISAKNKVKVDMMHIKEKFKYYMDEKLQVVELPYKGNELSMLVLLPNDPENLAEIEDTFTAESFNVFLSKMGETEVNVYFPKFKMTWGTFSLNNALAALGMPDAFDFEKANFSGINGKRDLYISDVFHQAFIEVDEEGTKAAASTGVVSAKYGGFSVVFRANHPFIFMIKDNHSESVLFMGRVMNPSE